MSSILYAARSYEGKSLKSVLNYLVKRKIAVSPKKARLHREPNPDEVIYLNPQTTTNKLKYAAIAAIIGYEAEYILEWVAFHYVVGFESITLYVNHPNQLPILNKILEKFINIGYLRLIEWPDITISSLDQPSVQLLAYAHAISIHSGVYRWLALIDADEFIVPLRENSIANVLQRFENYPALAVYWLNFGSNNINKRAFGLVTETFTAAATKDCVLNRQFKSIVQPHRIKGVFNAHRYLTDVYGVCAIDEAGVEIGNWNHKFNTPAIENIRINHYFVKSDEEFKQRLVYNAKFYLKDNRRILQRQEIEASTLYNDVILRFIPKVKKIMT